MMLLLIIIFIILIIGLGYKSKRSLHMLQQNLYNENNRYIKWTIKNISNFLNREIIGIILFVLAYFVFYDLNIYLVPIELAILVIYISMIRYWQNFFKNEQTKKRLVITKRVKRLIVTIVILYLIPLITLKTFTNQNLLLLLLIESIMVYLNEYVIFLAKIINTPIEKEVYNYYKHKAQKTLKSMPNLKIVGITGSYGKTSSKNILRDILNVKYNAFATPRNLNTYNGLIMSVNNYMDKFTDVFIAEMGAYVKGEIKGLCDLVHPKYGILTRIGTAHLETFGSEKNIEDGKFELIESLPSDGIGVLNKDDPKQKNHHIKNKVKLLWIGIDESDVDVHAENIKCTNKGTTFDVTFKGDKNKYHFETRLLGRHNVYNILSSLALGVAFGIDKEDLVHAVKGVKSVEHRLELKNMGSFYMIDDAYNSNPVGAKNAVEVLGMMPGVKVVVTPGMIELGDKENYYNEEFGKQIADQADYVVLIGEEKTKPIYNGLLESGFNKDKITVYNDVRCAYTYINELKMKEKKDIYALFENDLPDTYNEEDKK